MRCTVTAHVWVGSFPNLDSIRNRIWFVLRNGSHRNAALQTEWNTHGEQAFQFEILEKLEDGVLPMEVADLLKQKQRHWTAQLNAHSL